MNYKMLWIKLDHLISIRAWDINNMMMLFCKFAVVTELKMRLTQAFSVLVILAGGTTNLKELALCQIGLMSPNIEIKQP